MSSQREIDFVFFDIGGTLGERDPVTQKLIPYPSSAGLLKSLHDSLQLRVGIITNLGGQLTDLQALALLHEAQLDHVLDPHGFISDTKAGVAKPDVQIYQFAAAQVGLSINRCLYVGENFVEVIGALTAGMQALLKPSPPGRELPA